MHALPSNDEWSRLEKENQTHILYFFKPGGPVHNNDDDDDGGGQFDEIWGRIRSGWESEWTGPNTCLGIF